MNVVTMIGNIGNDPELKYTANGTAVSNVRIAVNDFRKTADGGTEKVTYWFPVTMWGKTAEILAKYCEKGSKIGVTGKLITREWQDKEGAKRVTTEIRADSLELLGGKRKEGNGSGTEDHAPPPDLAPDEEIPF